jgi:hypothetical protein
LDSEKCEILNYRVIFATKNSNKFQKTRFWKEKSVEDIGTLGPMAQATLVYIESAFMCYTWPFTMVGQHLIIDR